ncbi:conserved hypothetical protein [Pediculus humanus corporis]|uniref:RING-type E3 ubiquitin transferase n=1 Tax=Pediculus humanus subsp. corporis TaxID=121224 RepID=E0W0K4_PEDHC|nr:uncharacterized protein Phum_PHUM557580 [Pediculus humanus corporis]EEB19160.1 conserved hypothetical protein [Pediculus humanus corporis]
MDYLGDIICLSLDSVIFGVCLKAYLRNKHALHSIENAPEFGIDKHLEVFLNKNSGKFPYIAVRGSVKALGPAIKSLNHPSISGVIQKLSIRDMSFREAHQDFGLTENQRTINEIFNSIPFALTSRRGDVEVEVIDALAAEILDLEVVSDRFDPSNLGFMDHMWGFFTGIRKRGLQTIEEILKEGAYITAVGEVQKDGGSLRIQPPTDGTPFFISTMPVNSLVRRLDEKVKYYGWISFGFGVLGIFLFGTLIRKYFKKHNEWLKKEAERKRLESTRKERRKNVRNTEDLPMDKLCVVCQSNPKEVILLPCGHVCLCEDCSEQITNFCPVCKSLIENKNPAYIS